MSVTRAAYDASFANLVSHVAYRDSRRYENQSILPVSLVGAIRFCKFCYSIIGICLRLGTVSELPPPSNK